MINKASQLLYTVNLEILAAKIFSVSRIIDIFANINFSDLVLDKFHHHSDGRFLSSCGAAHQPFLLPC